MPRPKKGPLAVIDLGSNSIRAVIYDGLSRAPVTRFNERRLCGLGREVTRSGKLGKTGRACAHDSLKRFVAIARGMDCQSIDIVATAAIRQAKDGQSFIERASEELALPIDVLSGPEEAHFGALGVTCGFHAPDGIMGDLGGGSVEFADVPVWKRRIDGEGLRRSLPLGALVVGEALRLGGREEAQALIDREFAAHPELRGLASGRSFYVVGGSWRAIARSHMIRSRHPLQIIHGYELSPEEAMAVGAQMSETQDPVAIEGMPRKRAETAPAAGLVLAQAVRVLAPSRVIFSATGVREGRIFARLKRQDREQDPLLVAADELGRLANRSRAVGPAMIAWTETLFGRHETAERRRLRTSACLVSDTAWRDHPESRAREAFQRLVQYPFLGIDHAERAALAYTVYTRYAGAVHRDQDIAGTLELMRPEVRHLAEAIGHALELGYRLSGGAPEIIERCRLEVDGDTLRLIAPHDTVIANDEAVSVRLRAVAVGVGCANMTVRLV